MAHEVSRSAVVDREECDRLRLLGWELDGTGYQPRSGSVATLSGIHIHEAFAFLLDPEKGKDPFDKYHQDAAVAHMLEGYRDAFEQHGIRQAVTEDVERVLTEQQFMLEVMFRGWVKVRMPHFLSDYEVMSVERAWRWELAPGIVMPFRMDAIVRRRADGLLHIPDFKGASNLSATTIRKYEDSRQTMLYLTALEEYTNEPVGGMLYEFINRGSFKKDDAKSSPFYEQRIQQSPMTYGYRLPGEIDAWRADYTSAKGWVKTPAWLAHSAEEWVGFLSSTGVLEKLYFGTDPINPPPAFRQSIRRQIANQESDFLQGLEHFNLLREKFGDTHPAVQAHLEMWAVQKTERCNKYGEDYQCPFRGGGLCFLTNATELLREEPGFQKRIPHHAPESPFLQS